MYYAYITDGGILFYVDDNGTITGEDDNTISKMVTHLVNLSNNPQKIDPHLFFFRRYINEEDNL